MQGLMMQWPLLISSLLRHAEANFGDREIVSRRVAGDLHRYDYSALAGRARRVANALRTQGVTAGDRIATLAWNGHRHLELYYGIAGLGAVVHTINPRLHPDQLTWIANHAGGRLLFFDTTFLPLVEAIAPGLESVRGFVLLADRAQMPEACGIPGLQCYEDWIAAADDHFEWPLLDEHTACALCYTSGTTGRPKGVLYSHRSVLLHAYGQALPDAMNLSESDTVLPVVPMFHVNAWCLPYACCMVGAKLVLPGPHLDGKSVHDLLESEQVTFSAGVPTVWQGLLAYMEQHGLRFSTLRRTVIGGSACPAAMIQKFEQQYGVEVLHAWGMTETGPLGTMSKLKMRHRNLSDADQLAVKARQGRPVFGVELKTVDEKGRELPRDGTTSGELMVRGSWITSGYYREDGLNLRNGWFPTGDVSTIDSDGYMQITDRSKDVIKSGGEWIGSIDLENIAMGHPAVAMAACIGVKHPKWDERPLLVVVRKPGGTVERDELLGWFAGKVAKWWIPDDVVFVESIPLGATGKMQKHKLRERFATHRLPN